MSDEQLSLVLRARDEMSQVVGRASQSLNKLGQSGLSANSILSGIGAGVGIAGFLGVANAVSRLTDVMGDAVQAALEDEASVRRLNVALSDNDAAWRGNTALVERFVAAAQSLAFTDDQARDSLTRLVAVTGDVSRAMELSRTAMDLARLRGIDLASATDMVAKAQAGNIGALRRVLPFIDKNATSTQALAAIQQAAAGQAAAYADTTAGKLVTAQTQLSEALERLGYTVMPVVGQAADVLTTNIRWMERAFNDLAIAIDDLPLPDLPGDFDLLGATIENLPFVGAYIKANQLRDSLEEAAATAAEARDRISTMKDALDGGASSAGAAVKPTDAYSGALGRLGTKAQIATERLAALNGTLGYTGPVVTNAFTGFTLTVDQVNQGIADGVRLHQDYLNSLNKTTTGTGGATRATQGLSDAVDRMIERLRALDAAQQTVFDRYLSNLNAVLDTQLRAIDAAQAQRDADRQAIADRRALAEATRDLAEAQASGDPEKVREAQQRLSDIRDRINEAAKRKEEDDRRKALEATKDYIAKVGELVDQATNRGALANTLAAREKSLLESRAKAVAAGNTDEVALIDAKLAAIRAAEVRNQQAMDIAKATTAVQVYTTVHTKIAVDGKTLAEIVDKYLGEKPVH